MYNLERQEKILKILETKKSISVRLLAQLLFVSEPTVRRDLDSLTRQGKVQRTHGGVVLRKVSDTEIPLMYREDQNNAAKKAIAEKAAKLTGTIVYELMCDLTPRVPRVYLDK